MNLPTYRDLAKMIDHSLLHPTLTDAQVRAGCELSVRFGVATACVKPCNVPLAADVFAGTDVAVCAVAGFPHGNSHTAIKVAESIRAIDEGAREIDIVVNIGKVLGGDDAYVRHEVAEINSACVARGALLKVIFETDYLAETHIRKLCEICSEVGVAFVKTSTGYGFVKKPSGDYNYVGATEAHLRLMRQSCPPGVQIKAAGGVRTLDDLLKVRSLGVTRVGATATETMLTEAIRRGVDGVPGHLRSLAQDVGRQAPSPPAASPSGY